LRLDGFRLDFYYRNEYLTKATSEFLRKTVYSNEGISFVPGSNLHDLLTLCAGVVRDPENRGLKSELWQTLRPALGTVRAMTTPDRGVPVCGFHGWFQAICVLFENILCSLIMTIDEFRTNYRT
jgi:hypothetical protein